MSYSYYRVKGDVYRTSFGNLPEFWSLLGEWSISVIFATKDQMLRGVPSIALTEDDVIRICGPKSISSRTPTNNQPTESNNPMAQNIYEVAMIRRPTAEQRENGGKDELVLAPTTVLAESKDRAIAVATQTQAAKLKDVDLATVDIQVRAFV